MLSIEIDFESWKAITLLRSSEQVSEGDVVRKLLKLDDKPPSSFEGYWESEGARFTAGTKLEHRFRDGRVVEATVTPRGIEHNGTIYSGLSSAGGAVTKHAVDGWLYWFFRDEAGKLVSADTKRKS